MSRCRYLAPGWRGKALLLQGRALFRPPAAKWECVLRCCPVSGASHHLSNLTIGAPRPLQGAAYPFFLLGRAVDLPPFPLPPSSSRHHHHHLTQASPSVLLAINKNPPPTSFFERSCFPHRTRTTQRSPGTFLEFCPARPAVARLSVIPIPDAAAARRVGFVSANRPSSQKCISCQLSDASKQPTPARPLFSLSPFLDTPYPHHRHGFEAHQQGAQRPGPVCRTPRFGLPACFRRGALDCQVGRTTMSGVPTPTIALAHRK